MIGRCSGGADITPPGHEQAEQIRWGHVGGGGGISAHFASQLVMNGGFYAVRFERLADDNKYINTMSPVQPSPPSNQHHNTFHNPHIMTTTLHTPCLGHCRAQSQAWKSASSNPSSSAQKPSLTACETVHPAHAHCWEKCTVASSTNTSSEKDSERNEENASHRHLRAQESAVRAACAYSCEVGTAVGSGKEYKVADEEEEVKYDNGYSPPEMEERGRGSEVRQETTRSEL